MSPVRVVKAVAAPLVWLSVYFLRGLTIIGLGAYATTISANDQDSEKLAGAPRKPAAEPAGESSAELSEDERLWDSELAADDAGAS